MNNFWKMIKDESGAAAAEYALILAVIGAGIIVAAVALGGAVNDVIDCTAATIQDGAEVQCQDGTADAEAPAAPADPAA